MSTPFDRLVLPPERLAEASAAVPSPRQYSWQKTEFYGFVHFGMNTMTDREWGLGHEDPTLFDPPGVDTDQWVDALAAAGMGAVILTCKHHDGFALWPSAHSAHTVASSPWRDGGGDLVAELSRSCRRRGLGFGVYLSPWDRTEASYGSGDDYDDFFVAQLTELLTGYGDIFSVWFDGANGEGPDGRVQLYDWERYYAVVRELQPDAVISVCGPDVRWCGNEAGSTRRNEWSVVPESLRRAERTADKSQRADDGEFSRAVRSDEQDLGSRTALAATSEPLVWYPAEVNTSVRHGWFHHPAEDSAVRTADELFAIYLASVGGNATLLLNVPPTRAGVVAEPDAAVLRELGARIDGLRTRNCVGDAHLRFSSASVAAEVVADRTPDSGWWQPRDGDREPSITVEFPEARRISSVIVREHLPHGQLVERLEVRAGIEGARLQKVAVVDSVGYQRIIPFDPVVADRVEIVITQCRARPSIASIGVLSPEDALSR